jgi:hypothetical protein
VKAGEKIDHLIAEKVMGYEWRQKPGTIGLFWDRDRNSAVVELPKYSTKISAAWQVIDKLIESGAEVNVGFSDKWDCDIDYPIGCNWRKVGDTAPLAICLAALEAVGVTYEPTEGEHV